MACPAHPRRIAMRWALCSVLSVACVLAVGCGKEGTTPRATSDAAGAPVPAGPDLSTPASTLATADRAIEAGDFETLALCSTPEGIERVRRDLLAWHAILSDATGSRVRVPPPRDEQEKVAYKAGFSGDLSGLLHMLSRTEASADAGHSTGSGRGPAARTDVATPAEGIDRVETERVIPDGTRRRVVLVRRDGTWKIDRLSL